MKNKKSLLSINRKLRRNKCLNNFSIIVPVYNEARYLKASIGKLYRQLMRFVMGNDWEIILVENGSTDSSWAVCQWLSQHYHPFIKAVHLTTTSYGLSLKAGLLAGRFQKLFIVNVDFWDINFLRKAFILLDSCDLVNGSKTLIAAQDRRPF